MSDAYIVLPTGEWLPLKDNEMHFDVIKRSGFLNGFWGDEPDSYKFFKELDYADDDKISGKDEEAFDDIEFEYTQRAVSFALKKGVLRIRCFKAGDIGRDEKTILIAGEINRITQNIIETAFKKFNIPDSAAINLNIEDTECNEIFNGTYNNYKQLMK